ncbi:hypothetical protein P171DRAFT_353262 [Karstenula rhodostoma CBS 690.94]|uniref:Xylanolytic transcriptional activator regulatory domain-containing protein n=1 Tax=Karstenula rhodostoma CBS 690.94 TaxID=1392251 RepID=A0A9P4PT69_9PLEO|nr:hypothetical protein P171DRAFT_353262 [Karstenula rhodostoma CBS 690.94]
MVFNSATTVLGSSDNIHTIANDFFITTHQRIPILSRHRFYNCLQSISNSPRADLVTLCLCIALVQHMPFEKRSSNMQSPLYVHVKSLVGLLEMAGEFTIDLLHCIVLVTHYELGHGLHPSAYLSLAASAKIARMMSLHKKPWQTDAGQGVESMLLEEQKRAWWAIVNLDRFIALYHGETLLVTEDPKISDILPIEDLLWSEGSEKDELASLITNAPSLDTPSHVTLGQMARECQIAHIVGRLIRHMSNPTLDPNFNREEYHQIERTLWAYMPLLADEELKVGRYCGAFAICNSALFILYEFKLSKIDKADPDETRRILQCMEDVSLRCITFAELSFTERTGSTLHEVHSLYCPYSLFQAAIVQYRIWKQNDDLNCKMRIDFMKNMLQEFARRWGYSCRDKYRRLLHNR